MTQVVSGPQAPPPVTRRQVALLVALALAALGWRLVAVSQKVLIETDGAHFGHLARLALSSGWRAGLDPAWPPLLPWLAALAARLLGGLAPAAGDALAVEQAGYLVSALAGAASVPMTWLLGRRWVGAPVAWGGALLLAAHPQALRYSASMMSESLFASLVLATLLALEHGTRPVWRRALAGLGTALAILTRPEGWILAAVGVLDTLLWGSPRGHTARALAYLLPLALVGLPWLAFLQAELGGPTLGAKGPYNFHLAHQALY